MFTIFMFICGRFGICAVTGMRKCSVITIILLSSGSVIPRVDCISFMIVDRSKRDLQNNTGKPRF